MKTISLQKLFILFCISVWFIFSGSMVYSQEVMLDRMEKCGDLICYPEMDNPNNFYYLPDQPRIASKDGKPQFSFLKYARTQETGKAGIGDAGGGGIVHFLVTYGPSEGRIKNAEKALQERHPEAKIAGPIVYRKGSFALITSFKEGNELLTKVVAVGKAPLMEGQKTAVSMALTREGAELLWASFQTDNPDISLVFDMEFAGIREPYEATLEADWSSIAKSDRIQAGFKYKWFGADVDMLFQELRQTGAIKITTKGENASMDRILESANEKLLKVMFEPVTADDLTRAAAEGSYDSLNQAAKMLKDAAASGSTSTGASGKTSGIYKTIVPYISYLLNKLSSFTYADTKEFLDKSLLKETMDKTDNHFVEAMTNYIIAEEYYRSGRFQDALNAFIKSYEDYDKSKNATSKGRATILYNIGVTYFKLERFEEAIAPFDGSADLFGRDTKDGQDSIAQIMEIERIIAARTVAPQEVRGEQAAIESASDAYNRANRLYEEARKAGFDAKLASAALEAFEAYQRDHKPTGSRAEEVDGRIRMLRERLKTRADASVESNVKPGSGKGEDLANALLKDMDSSKDANKGNDPVGVKSSTDDKKSETGINIAGTQTASTGTGSKETAPATTGTSTGASQTTGASATSATPKPATTAQKARSDGSPGFSLVASYKMKKIKRSGKMIYNMNNFRTETQAFAMAENIGQLFRFYGRDQGIFRAITIDDPVFKQREIKVTLDGQDASTFTKYMNFVTVKMKKNHQGGEITTGEIVVTPETFNTSGNNFSFIYGWKDDTDRAQWLNYEYQAIWSFYGGIEIRTPWTKTDSPMLALIPPHHYKTISIEGNGKSLTDAGVRHGVLTFTCRVGDKNISQQVTIRNNGPAPSVMVDIPEDIANPETKVDITWHLANNRKLSEKSALLEGDIIYWDELPKGGI